MNSSVEKQMTFIIRTLYLLLILGIIFFIFKYALPVLFPFIFGFGMAFILKRPVEFIRKTLRLNKKFLGVVILLLIYMVFIFILLFFGSRLFGYIGELFHKLPEIYLTNIEPAINIIIYKIQDIIPQISMVVNLENINQYIMNILNSLSITAVNFLASIATTVPSFVIKLVFAVIASFLFVIDYDKASLFIMKQFSPKVQQIIINVKDNIVLTIIKFIKAYSILMFLTFFQLSIGFTLFKVQSAIPVAALIAILDILPAIGVGGILIPWGIIEFIKGNYNLGIGLLVIYAIIVILRSILEPKIIGKQIGLHPIITLMSMFLGAQILGFFGIFIFPVIATIIKYLNDSGTLKLFK